MELPFNPVWLLVTVPIIALMLLSAAKNKGAATADPYARVEGLFTENERRFLGVLEQAAAPNRVFGKVRVADVITVRKGLSREERQGALNRVTQKHLDFVVCHPDDLGILYVVELDDKSHERADRRARDAFLSHALAAAGVALIRVNRSTYGIAELKGALVSHTVPKAA